MNIVIKIPDYDGNAIDVIWEQDACYSIKVDEENVILSANKQGLLSFAKQMIYLAYSEIPNGSHVHFDSFFTNNNAEYDLVITKGNV